MSKKRMRPLIYEAKRFNVKASILIEGLTGTGKTGLALALAHGLAKDWSKVGMTDSENRSANLYEGIMLNTGVKVEPFKKIDLLESDGYSPVNYMACIEALHKQAGCTVVISDSITHAWQRSGGVLDLVNQKEQGSRGGKFSAWGDPEVVENKNALFEMLRNDKVHIISTVRVKERFGMVNDETTNKTKVVSLGEQQQTQEGIKYEPDLVLHMVKPGSKNSHPQAEIIKSRYPMFELGEVYEFTPELIESIRTFLEEGADPEELVKAQHDEYQKGIMEFCSRFPGKKPLYDMLKKNAGHEQTKISDIPLKDLKMIYLDLVD